MTQHSVKVDDLNDGASVLPTMRQQQFERERRQVVKIFTADNGFKLEAEINEWLLTNHPMWDVEQISLCESVWDSEGANWIRALIVFRRVLVRAG